MKFKCEWGQACTCFIDKLGSKNWAECCKKHDQQYYDKNYDRGQADKNLYECVKQKGGRTIAILMYVAVRVFGRHFRKKLK